jgi:type IV pilus assembly protein PilZ
MVTPPTGLAGGRQGILSLTIKDKSALYAAYMPFIKNGGLFIPTTKEYQLGDEVFMLLTLMDEKEKLPVAGKIVWITPKGAQGKRQAHRCIHQRGEGQGQRERIGDGIEHNEKPGADNQR